MNEKNESLIKDVKVMQEMLFSWLDASASKNNILINTITTGTKRSSIVDEFFLQAFNNPADGFKLFQEYRNSILWGYFYIQL